MRHHLDRLIDLAKRTGDRLIVHDSLRGDSIVIMDVDEYEMLNSEAYGYDEPFEPREYLDEYRCESDYENDFYEPQGRREENPYGYDFPVEDQDHNQDFVEDDWHTTGEVLDNRYDVDSFHDEDDFPIPENHMSSENEMEQLLEEKTKTNDLEFQDEPWQPEVVDEPFEGVEITDIPFEEPPKDIKEIVEISVQDDKENEMKNESEIKVEEIKLDSLRQEVPYKPAKGAGDQWEEEQLPGDEPVFLEEPVL